MQLVAPWLTNDTGFAEIGMVGCWKSNFRDSHPPNSLISYLGEFAAKVISISVDLNSLSANTLDTFYRQLLRSFCEMKECFP